MDDCERVQEGDAHGYCLDDQVGFLLRRANQRHRAIFSAEMPIKIPPTQFAALAKLGEVGEVSQNLLGRLTAMDSATVAGVVARLADAGWVKTSHSETDARTSVVSLTPPGREVLDSLLQPALNATEKTMVCLSDQDRAECLRILRLLSQD
ncbi:MAG: MarR family winged helix-turn-helix transcriptional regulator [Acidimicrobiales bacterium]